MSAHKPEEWPGQFEQHLNAGNLEAIIEPYEPNATFVSESGELVFGRAGIRPILAGLIARKKRLQAKLIKVVTAGDIAVLYTDWQDTTAEDAEEHTRAIEVVRRQPDGTWLLVVGDPNGRG